MRTLRSLPFAALASLGLLPAPARAENPPYAIQANPPGSAAEGTPARFKPVRSGTGAVSNQVCKLEIWPEGSAHGAAWIGASDPGCSREDAVNLPAGRYVAKLGVGWQSSGGVSQFATAQTPYEVTSNVNKLQMWKCDFTPAQPMAGRTASVSWEVRSGAPAPLGPFRVSILAGHQPVDSFTVGALAAGAAVTRTVSWTPQAPGKFRVECTVDPENVVHEALPFRKDNTMWNQLTVVPTEVLKPTIVLGTLRLGAVGWKQDYTVCNVDLDAFYKVEVTGCAWPCVAGFSGVPSRDYAPNVVSADGSSIAPGCPGGLVSRAAFKPGTAEGPRNQYEDKTYTLKVTASRDGRSAGTSIPLRVPQHCGMLSIPICVPMEGGKGR
ncbi:MAG: hypothetical protein NEA02_17720 [Thermoanaerobaculia bacterium]|nr:hypothetical protein [Thermoanaerobaculia bacterium]